MGGVVREVNIRLLGKGLEQLSANGGRFEINYKLAVCERRKLGVNVGKSKVMRCSRCGNGDRMQVMLNGKPLEKVDCFKYLGSQVAADGGF